VKNRILKLKFYNDSVSEKIHLTVNLLIFASVFINDEMKINRRWNIDLFDYSWNSQFVMAIY